MVVVRRHKANHSRGAVAVELALVLPVILLVTFGAIRYGWFYLKAQYVTNAARYGARVAIRAGVSPTTVENTIHTLLENAGITESVAYTGTWENDGYELVIDTGGVSWGDLEVTNPVTVTITVYKDDVDILPIKFLFGYDIEKNKIISSSVTMAKEGF